MRRFQVLEADRESGDVSAFRLAVSAEMDVNFDDEKMEVFSQAWRYLSDNFED